MNNDNEIDTFLFLLNSCYTQIADNIEKQITNKNDSSFSPKNCVYQQLNQHIHKLEELLDSMKGEDEEKENFGSKLELDDPNKESSSILLKKIEKLEKENEELKNKNNEQFSLLNDIKSSVEQLKDEKDDLIKSNIKYKETEAEISESSFNDVSNTSIISEFINGISDIKMGVVVSELITMKTEEKSKIDNDKLLDIYSEPERIYLTETMLLNQSLKKMLNERRDIANDSYKTPRAQPKSLIPTKFTSSTINLKNEKKQLFKTPQDMKRKVIKSISPSKDKENIYPTPSSSLSKIPKGINPSGKNNKVVKASKLSISKNNVGKVNNNSCIKRLVK